MKREKMFRVMELIDDEFVEEADRERVRARQRRRRSTIIGSCVSGLAVAAAALWLFLPFRSERIGINEYRDSEYYQVIQKLDQVTRSQNRDRNNYERYIEPVLENGFYATKSDDRVIFEGEDAVQEAPAEAPQASGANKSTEADGQNYEEITDNQVGGVIEADRIKRSDKYIYYLYGDTLHVYSIEGEASEEVGAYTITNEKMTHRYTEGWEFYLSKDCNTIMIVGSFANKDLQSCVGMLSLDVSDPANIREIGLMAVTGNYLSSRYTGDTLLLMAEFRVKKDPDFSEEENFLPQVDTGEGMESIPAEDIILPETVNNSRYTVVCKLDGNTFELEDTAAFLSYSSNFYVSEENIFATRTYSETTENGQISHRKSMTEISRLSYAGETLEQGGTINVEGYVKDQYSLDEYGGVLRVVTTTSEQTHQISEHDGLITNTVSNGSGTSANLYCIDLAGWEIVAQVIGFAPRGEVVQSARFDGDTAYVCTAVELTDPVFFFDLSDLNNITYKETGNIEGYSSSLINFNNGYLLGIGVGASRNNLKLEVYEESGAGVVSVCKFELENVDYSEDYKAYYVDRKNQLIGLGITDYRGKEYGEHIFERYLLVFFDGYELRELLNVPLPGSVDLKRAVYIDGYFYMFGEDAFVVEKIGG